MHTYKLLTDQAELDALLLPVLQRNGSEIPPAGCYVAAVELDEGGSVVGYQMAQNALFLEGMWSDGSAHLLTLYHMCAGFIEKQFGTKRYMTMTRDDEQGQRIGRIAVRLGFEKMPWQIFRRKV